MTDARHPDARRQPAGRLRRTVLWTLAVLATVAIGGVVWFRTSLWPSIWLIRFLFDRGAATAAQALEQHLPPDVVAQRDLAYDPGDPDARLDVYRPATQATPPVSAPTIVWIHGGAWVSGDKDQVGNYLRILAGQGFTTVSVGYSIAPERTYPTPVLQANRALGHLTTHAAELHVDATRFVLAGDSAGAHIAAQLANAITSPPYAKELGFVPTIGPERLVGTILFCGAYDTKAVDLEGAFGGFLRTVLEAYSGTTDFTTDARFASASVQNFVTERFPPTFVAVGSKDPLAPQSVAFAAALARLAVRADTLFFPADHEPPLGHEFQFDLDGTAGRTALARAVAFARGL